MPQRRDLKQSEEVQKLLEQGRKQGNVLTYEDINDTLNEDQVDPDRLGDILQMVGDEGIKVGEKSDDTGGSRSASSERRSSSRTAVASAPEELPAVDDPPPVAPQRSHLFDDSGIAILRAGGRPATRQHVAVTFSKRGKVTEKTITTTVKNNVAAKCMEIMIEAWRLPRGGVGKAKAQVHIVANGDVRLP